MYNNDNFKIVAIPRHYRLFSFWFAISFILNGYASGLPGLSLGSVVFIILIIYAIRKSRGKVRQIQAIELIILFLVISLIDYLIVTNSIEIKSIFVGFSKYIVWAFMLSFCSSVLFCETELQKRLLNISYILISYLILQLISYFVFSIRFPNIYSFAFLQPYAEGYAAEIAEGVIIYRPASFLSESSFLGNFLVCTLIMVLSSLEKQYDKKLFKKAIYLSVGVIMSTSTSTIILLPIIWVMLGKNCYKRHKQGFRVVISCLLVFVVFVFIIFESLSNSGNVFFENVFYTFDKFNNLENSSRFGASYDYLNYIPKNLKAFGVGIGNEIPFLKTLVFSDAYYMNSATTLLAQVGYVGLILFLLYLFYLLYTSVRYKHKGALTLIIIYLLQGIGSGIWFSTYGVLYMFIASGYLCSNMQTKFLLHNRC